MEWLLIWIFCGVAAAMIGANKNAGFLGFLLGLFFGPFGILFAVLMNGNRKQCPACKSKIHPQATICPQCRTALSPGGAVEHHETTGMPKRAPAIADDSGRIDDQKKDF